MENIIIPIITIIFSGVTSAIVSNIYSRRNLKSSQYIDVITSERIKWIGNVRDDITALVSSVMIHIGNAYHEDTESGINLRETYDRIDTGLKSVLGKSEIVTKAVLLKLKLNPAEDGDIIGILDVIIDLFTPITYNIANSNCWEEIDREKLINLCQAMLKREWERVKDETRKK